MKRILVFGAGRSAYFTIQYLLAHAAEKNWSVTIADSLQINLDSVIHEFPGAKTIIADVSHTESRQELIKKQDIVISLLPASFHIFIATDCVAYNVHLITPSYISPELALLNNEAIDKKIIILNEIGLDPGIDHMSTMNLVHRLKEEGAIINSYKSYCGGLIAKDDHDNPWRYKISWNPYNITRSGHDGGLSLLNSNFHYVSYSRLYNEIEVVEVEGENFESYYNRNSIMYIEKYGLQEAKTFLRGTLRYPGFCKKWDTLVKLGITNDNVTIENESDISWENYLNGFLPANKKNAFDAYVNNDPEVIEGFNWLMNNAGNVELKTATPAENLQKLLEKKWALNPNDKDRVVLVHEIEYEKDGKQSRLKSWMDLEGNDSKRTAMAKTVGLPLALAAELIADDKIKTYGVILPTLKEVYVPLLTALAKEGIGFKEEVIEF